MAKEVQVEVWKKVKFDFNHTNKYSLEVSNLGRVRTFNSVSDGNILRGSLVKGYKIIRLKLFTPRDEKLQVKFDKEQQKAFKMAREIKQLVAEKASKASIKEATTAMQNFKTDLSKRFVADLKLRTVNYHSLVHRLVATAFLLAPKKSQTVVGHIDFNKLNNKATNLKWMTLEENYAHQLKNPALIKSLKQRRALKNAKLK